MLWIKPNNLHIINIYQKLINTSIALTRKYERFIKSEWDLILKIKYVLTNANVHFYST